MKNKLFYTLFALCCTICTGAATDIWKIAERGEIVWKTNGKPHTDHIEMSGKSVSVILRYGIDSQGQFHINKSMVWPMLRTVPNNTHASLMRRFTWDPLQLVSVNGLTLENEKTETVFLDGTLRTEGTVDLGWKGKLKTTRCYFPSSEQPALIERYTLTNTGNQALSIEIPQTEIISYTDARTGVDGSYMLCCRLNGSGTFRLEPGKSLAFSASISGQRKGESPLQFNAGTEENARRSFLHQLSENLILETPDTIINTMFAFSKIRACESIYETAGGPLHGPGGESYYAAIWANDQAEYINPYFPFTGYDYGNRSALNAFRHFARFMNDQWKPIPSSIIAEGKDIWNGAGDRGDAAMIAYGAARYALARGDRQEAETLWPLIAWCLEYCKRQLTPEGVVASDADELEGRFPAGKANLCTSALYYDALISAAYLSDELQQGKATANGYRRQAKQLRAAIEHYFGANVEGFDTYAYYQGNDVLRSWICIPLTMGIDERAESTIRALFSPRLWTENGLLTQAGTSTFWDRSTLYALRGVYIAGATEKATAFLHDYSRTRLLGAHVPYAIEAWPEGEQRHLSAESGLYGRIITEGLFGIRPTGLHRFTLTPRLPENWDHMALRRIRAFGSDFDIDVKRLSNGKLRISIREAGEDRPRVYQSAPGKPVTVRL